MKKIQKIVATLFGATLLLAACGGGAATPTETITVGASPAPHAEILEQAKPLLADKGYALEIVEFNDYVLPNQALDADEIDANYFQHIPFFDLQVAENGFDFAIASKVHIEPIGIYSQTYKAVANIKDGDEVFFSNSVADHGRVLSLLETQGLIKLDPKVADKTAAEIKDVIENPKNLVFKTDFAPELLPQMYLGNEAPIVVINTNFAIGAGINPLEDSIALEDSTSPYVNIVAVQSKNKDSDKIAALNEVLSSKEIQEFILEKYKGAVVPA